jgi:hypothetical protein
MKIKFKLPGRLRLPYRITRWLTSFIYHDFDYNMWKMYHSGLLPEYRERIGCETDTIRVWRDILAGRITMAVEVCHVMDTAVATFEVELFGLTGGLQIEDWQESGPEKWENTGIYGSHVEITKQV